MRGSKIDRKKHLVLETVHPSGLSAHRGFFGCRHFSRGNEYLTSHSLSPIDWQLPMWQQTRCFSYHATYRVFYFYYLICFVVFVKFKLLNWAFTISWVILYCNFLLCEWNLDVVNMLLHFLPGMADVHWGYGKSWNANSYSMRWPKDVSAEKKQGLNLCFVESFYQLWAAMHGKSKNAQESPCNFPNTWDITCIPE